METKYLSDGRKVAVIGQLNNVESIVQEVFVSDSGDQIPSGEKFTTKSLHDEPVKSWKEKEADKITSRLEAAKSEIASIERELRVMKGKRQGHADILNQNEKFISLVDDNAICGIADILMGNIKYIVSDKYSLKVQEFEDGIFQWENNYGDSKYEGLKMMSLYALKSSPYKSNRKCRVSISNYTDGSGNESDPKFFKGHAELSEYLFTLIEAEHIEGKLTAKTIKEASKYIKVPKKYINKVKRESIKALKSHHDTMAKSNTDNLNKKIKELENSLQ